MNLTISDILSWLILGALAGSLAGMIVKRKKSGLGHFHNLAVGLVGAMIGGLVVRLLKIDFGLGQIVLRWEDMAAALVGALLFICLLTFSRKRKKRS